jgi:NADPH:quinone reductase-like Zn-dependent oxidoreductase
MKALRFDRLGDLDALHLEAIDTPEPAPGRVRVRVVAAGLNVSDVKNVLGRFAYTTLPRVPGRDFAGVVDRGPAELVGREVWGTGNELGFTSDGSHAEYLTLPLDAVAARPASLSFAQCAASGVPYTTALNALERAVVGDGATVVVIGLGAVGKAAVDIARWRGARVACAVRRPEHRAYLEARGVAAIELGTPEELHVDVHEHFAHGADVVFDTTGAWLDAAVSAIANFGRIAVIAAPADGHVRLPTLNLYRKGGSVVGINSLLYDTRACAPMLDELRGAFDTGALPPPLAPSVVPFAAALDAYREVNGGRADKVVFTMDAPGGEAA